MKVNKNIIIARVAPLSKKQLIINILNFLNIHNLEGNKYYYQ